MIEYETYIWQMGVGTGIFRFQTDDPQIARKLLRTNGWMSVVTDCNRPIWMFQKTFNTPQDARKKLLSLTNVPKLEKGSDSGEFFAITNANETSRN